MKVGLTGSALRADRHADSACEVSIFWTLRLSGRLLEETRRRARWKVARIQSPVSARYQHALKTLCQLSPKRRGQLAPTHAFARHLAIGVAIDIYWVVVEDAKLPINTGTF